MPVLNTTSRVTGTMTSLQSIPKSHILPTKKQKFTAQTKVWHENSTDNGRSGILGIF
jgi:hypothetical protein